MRLFTRYILGYPSPAQDTKEKSLERARTYDS